MAHYYSVEPSGGGSRPHGGEIDDSAQNTPATEASPPVKNGRLKLLDGFELTYGGELVALPTGPQRMVAFLALQNEPRLRAYVARKLWFETTGGHASACLRSALWRLRCCCRAPIIDATRTHLRLAFSITVDVREHVAIAKRLVNRSVEAEDVNHHALLEGELLPGWRDDWVIFERERMRQLRLHALEALAERLTDQGRYGEAVEAGLAALHGEPLRETAHRALIKTYLAEGNRAEAIRQ
jgi:DNA-binding SARP family transcriptional activator